MSHSTVKFQKVMFNVWFLIDCALRNLNNHCNAFWIFQETINQYFLLFEIWPIPTHIIWSNAFHCLRGKCGLPGDLTNIPFNFSICRIPLLLVIIIFYSILIPSFRKIDILLLLLLLSHQNKKSYCGEGGICTMTE